MKKRYLVLRIACLGIAIATAACDTIVKEYRCDESSVPDASRATPGNVREGPEAIRAPLITRQFRACNLELARVVPLPTSVIGKEGNGPWFGQSQGSRLILGSEMHPVLTILQMPEGSVASTLEMKGIGPLDVMGPSPVLLEDATGDILFALRSENFNVTRLYKHNAQSRQYDELLGRPYSNRLAAVRLDNQADLLIHDNGSFWIGTTAFKLNVPEIYGPTSKRVEHIVAIDGGRFAVSLRGGRAAPAFAVIRHDGEVEDCITNPGWIDSLSSSGSTVLCTLRDKRVMMYDANDQSVTMMSLPDSIEPSNGRYSVAGYCSKESMFYYWTTGSHKVYILKPN